MTIKNSSEIEVEITEGEIDPSQLLSFLHESGHGAEVCFSGVIRDRNAGKKVMGVSYDCFVPLAQTTFQKICLEAEGKWGPGLRCKVIHRIGRLKVGEVSVWIGVSAGHRDEAYQASRFIIENIKHRAPIWKKEHYEDGETQWLEGHALCGKSH